MVMRKKAPFWFVVLRKDANVYETFCFVHKNGKNAQERARNYAEQLARENPGLRVYVARPRARYKHVPPSCARMDVMEI